MKNSTTKAKKIKALLLKEIRRANADGMGWRVYFDQSTHTDESGRDIDFNVYDEWLEIKHGGGELSSWEYIPETVRTLGELREYLQTCATVGDVRKALEDYKAPHESAWDRGVKATALDLLDGDYNLLPRECRALKRLLLNGAENWNAYSWGGSGLIFDSEIAARFCTPSELKRTGNGNRRPNSREEWLDVQARGLFQAERLICRVTRLI